MIKTVISEYGLPWVVNRSLYSAKLKMMRKLPSTEKVFEKKINIKRINIFKINKTPIEQFLFSLAEDKKSQIISNADNAIVGKILGFSSIELDYGKPMNWHLSPLTGKIVDKTMKWYQIPDFDPERGDIKAVWEASRFTHFFYFTRAFMITKEKKYYDAFSYQIRDWLKENSYSYGPNYKCGQEATLRMINILIAYSVFASYGLTTKNDQENVKKIVEGSYKKVLSNFFYAHKCIKNNHTLSEITGLIIGAWACKDENRLKAAYLLLDKEIQKQFLKDGGYRQFSFNYQRFALQIMEFVLKISESTNLTLSNESKYLIKNSANLIYQMQDESGDVPNYGSNDGALIFPVTSCGYRDFRPVVNTISVLIDGYRVYEHGEYDEEILWFSSKKAEDFSFKDIEKESTAFNESGYYSMRHNDSFLMTVLQNFDSRPAQMDQLHIDLWHKGINVFCDSGTYSYATEIGKKMALTAAHNTVKMIDVEQMKKHGPFLIYDWTSREKSEHSNNHFIGTMRSRNGYSHTREINKDETGYSITDIVESNSEFCEFYYHTPCEVKVLNGGVEIYYNNKLISTMKIDGDIRVEKTYRSLYYMKKEEINCLIIKCAKKNKKFIHHVDIELL